MRTVFFCLCILSGLGHGSIAQVIHVPEDFASIQEGIENAESGDTVLIDGGTYFENINFLGKAITVASHYLLDGDTAHITKTIIDGSHAVNPDTASVVTMWSGEDTTSILCGLTITGGSGTFVRNFHGPLVQGLKKASYFVGGGVLLYNSGGKIIHNIIEKNHMIYRKWVRGSLGSGILASVNHNHHATIRNNIIRNNTSNAFQAWGGGIGIHGGALLVEHNSIINNMIETEKMAIAGGLLIENEGIEGTIEEVVIRNNLIAGNQANSITDFGGGGGIALAYNLESEEVQIYNNIIANNEAGNVGGGIYSYETRANIFSNLIFNNRARQYGVNIGTEGENDLDLIDNQIWTGDNWIATLDGLAGVCAGRSVITGFHPSEGIRIRPFTNSFSLDPSNGEILFGNGEGLISFDPSELQQNAFIAPSVIMDYHSYKSQNVTSGKFNIKKAFFNPFRLNLPVGKTLMVYKFGVLDFTSPSNSTYIYCMKGYAKDTLMVLKTQYATVGNLKKGYYKFWSARVDSSGTGSPEGITLNIRVRPPLYRSGWVICCYVLALLFLVTILISRVRNARLKWEKEALETEVHKRTLELQEKNSQIIEMERLKTRFFTDVSHEIRTPLSLITGPLDQLIKRDYPDSDTREWLNMIRRNSRRLLQLVNQLLDISRLDSGQMKLVLQHTDVLKHLMVLVSEFRSLADSRKINFIIDIPDEEIVTWNDQEKITKVVSNLLSNAFKFTPEGGTVTCRVKGQQGSKLNIGAVIRIIVADTGAGIPMEEREKIFNRFYRSGGDQYEETGGTGIGLALTRELIKLMRGEIVVKSIQSKGSVFVVSIPLGKEHLKREEYILKGKSSQKEGEADTGDLYTKPNIRRINKDVEVVVLIVEDNRDLRTFIRENLSNDFLILEATDGNEGLRIAQLKIPDLIISDVMMPGMDGMELCKHLKGDERTSHIPVIMLTAKSTNRDKIKGLEQGADDYIYKPFSIEELTVRTRNLMEQRESLRKKYSGMIGMDWGTMKVTTLEEQFLKKLTGYISEHLHDFELDVSVLKEQMSMSREHLFRKLKALTGESPSSLIRVMRLKAAANLLKSGEKNITRVSLETGFANPSYFARCFKDYFGKSPRDFQREMKGAFRAPTNYTP